MHPVDEPGGDGAHADVAARLHASLGAPALDPAVRQRHLQAIRDRAVSLPAPAAAPVPVRAPARVPAGVGWARRLASSVTAAGLVVVMGASGAVAASHQTLPGQALYPVKEVTERLVLAAALPAGLAVDRHLAFAERRLDEAATLVDRDDDPALVAEAIAAHTRLMERAGTLADDDRELAGRVEAATLTARGRLAHLLEEGLPEVAAGQARAALAAVQDRLDGRPGAPPATLPALPAPPAPPGAGAPETRPDPASPATPHDRSLAPRPPAAPAPPGEPGDPGPPGERANPPATTGPPAQSRQREPSPPLDQQSQATPRDQQTRGSQVTPSRTADDRGETGDRQRLPLGEG